MINLSGIDSDHVFVVWWVSQGTPVTTDNPLVQGWCVFREVEWDY